MNERLNIHYNKKYSKQSDNFLKKIVLHGRPMNRNEAVVCWAKGGDTVLEVGCGSGDLLYSLEDRYQYLLGVEFSEPRVNYLKRVFAENQNIKIIYANIECDECEIAQMSVDTIIMTDVIEHLIDPISTLQKLICYLKPGGECIIATPNIAKWTRRLKLLCGYFPGTASLDEGLLMYDRKTPTDLYDEGHLHYFTNRSLTKLLEERVGFSSVKVQGYGMGFFSYLFPNLFSDCFLIAKK